MQTRLDTPGEGDAILSHSPILWIIPPIFTAWKIPHPQTPHTQGRFCPDLAFWKKEKREEQHKCGSGRAQGREVTLQHPQRPARTFCSSQILYFNHTWTGQGRQRLSPSQHLWKISLNNPTNIHCMRFPFLHSPGRTQEKSILQPTAIKHFGVGTKF